MSTQEQIICKVVAAAAVALGFYVFNRIIKKNIDQSTSEVLDMHIKQMHSGDSSMVRHAVEETSVPAHAQQ